MHPKKIICGLSLLTCVLSCNGYAQLSDDGQFYPNPGIVANRGGKWVGSDHLYNLSNRVGIVIEIVKPTSLALPITDEMIRARISDIFRKAKIQPIADSTAGKPPSPFFHMLVMVYPIEKGYTIFCEGRLFEHIELDRIRLDEQTVMQGITWESQNFTISPEDQLTTQLYKSVDEIATTFTDRFTFYENIRTQIKR